MIPKTQAIVPEMMSAVEAVRREAGHGTSSHAFASLLLWQADMGLSIHLEEDFYAVRCLWRVKDAWFFPCGREEAVCGFLEELAASGPVKLCYMREQDAALLEKSFPGRFTLRECPEDHEYIYDREGQEKLTGGRFVRLRNDLHYAQREGELSFRTVGHEDLDTLTRICSEWHPGSEDTDLRDAGAVRALTASWDRLGAIGIIASVDGEPMAAAAGFGITDDTFDVALCKARSKLRGLPVYTRKMLMSVLLANFTRINAEEDLGLPGLRQMKTIMRPVELIKIYEGKSCDDASDIE